MSQIKYIFLFILLCMAMAVKADKEGNVKIGNKILVISSYGEDYQWSNSIIDEIKAKLSDHFPGIELNIEYLSSERFNEPQIWVGRINMLLSNYVNEVPTGIILISDEAWMAYRESDNKRFKDVPIFLCGVKPHSITLDQYAENISTLKMSSFSSTQLDMQEYNATGVIRMMNVAGYVDMMDNLIPNIDQYAIITDNRFYGVYCRILFEEYFNNNKPSFHVQYLDARFIDTDMLLGRLNKITPSTGILMTSWLTGQSGYEYSKQYIYKRMASVLKGPIFITNDIGLSTGYFLGGYFYDSHFWGEKLGDMVLKMLSGIPVAEIDVETYQSNQAKINWDVMSKFNIHSDLLPADTEYVNRPESIVVKYYKTVIALGIFLLLILLSYVYILSSNIQLKRAQKIAQQAINDTRVANENLMIIQNDLKIALVKAESADRLKSAFISNIDHEIRTPLNSIVGFSSLLPLMENKEDMDEAATQISQSSEHLLQIVKGIIDISQLDSGTAQFDYAKIDLSSLFDDVVSLSANKCGLKVQVKFNPPDEPISIITDPHRVIQVLTNFVNNAIKFTDEGVIEMGYFSCDEDKSVEFYVQDTGVGMTHEEKRKVFDRFYKTDSYKLGAGLGLSIVKQIITTLGGTYGVTSQLGVGSRFWFRINRL